MIYQHGTRVVSVYDGDTVTVDVDLGMGIWNKGVKIRLAGIDAPEVRGDSRESGIRSRDYLRSLVDGKRVKIETERDKTGKYGRYIATIWLPQADGNDANVNQYIMKAGHAKPYPG